MRGDYLDYEWALRAACARVDPELFYPDKGGNVLVPKMVCLGCEVRMECLTVALENDERFGVWGGLSERERRKLKRDHLRRKEPST